MRVCRMSYGVCILFEHLQYLVLLYYIMYVWVIHIVYVINIEMK